MDTEPGSHTKSETVYDIVIGTLFTVGIAVNVWIMVDAATDGELTKSAKRWWERNIKVPFANAKMWERDRSKVVAHANWITYQAANETDSDNGNEDKT